MKGRSFTHPFPTPIVKGGPAGINSFMLMDFARVNADWVTLGVPCLDVRADLEEQISSISLWRGIERYTAQARMKLAQN